VSALRLLNQAGRLLGLLKPDPPPEALVTAAREPDPLAIEATLAPYAALIRRIRVDYGCPEDEFRRHLYEPMAALARWLHLLPGPPGSAFDRRGGAIQQALTNCLHGLQTAEGLTFENSSEAASVPGQRQAWRLACALGGLFSSLPEVLGRIEVVSEDGRLWPGVSTPLTDWLAALASPRYHYGWLGSGRDGAHVALYAVCRCMPPEVLRFLDSGGGQIAADLLGCLAGSNPRGQVAQVVGRLAASAGMHMRPASSPKDRLPETIRRLLGTPDWLPNSPGGLVWYGTNGLYLLWPETAPKLLAATSWAPNSAPPTASQDKLLRELVDSGLIDASPSAVVEIRTPGHDSVQRAVRLANHRQLLAELGLAATPLELHAHAPEGEPGPGDTRRIANDTSRAGRRGGKGLAGHTPASEGVPEQSVLDFKDNHADADGPCTPPRTALRLDTTRISNARTREAIEQVVARLDGSFDTMLAKIVSGGVFVALTEFVGQGGDGAAVVRALHEAQLLACDGTGRDKRVVGETFEGAECLGVVLRSAAFVGYADWIALGGGASHYCQHQRPSSAEGRNSAPR
jgi:conjugal transfer pilus assembly protein TraI